MPRIPLIALLAAACGGAPARSASPSASAPALGTSASATQANLAPPATPSPATPLCTEVIGLTITAEWYAAGFEQLVDDARFQARTRAHTFVDQWADPAHVAWSEPLTSACTEHSASPDRLILFAANWRLKTQAEWTQVLEAFVVTAEQRYPGLRELAIFTVLRGPHNETCGDPKSVVDPMIDQAIASVVSQHPQLVRGGPKLEAADCSVFDKGGPHLTAEGRKLVARQLAGALQPAPR